ncbi:hypothetical protein [Nocardia sp. R7R-8]|uniref:hypothetical protein n=1 Tax=Nocardia sp. R7R-8 TaxID=3459304 RepID=UPI00403D6678
MSEQFPPTPPLPERELPERAPPGVDLSSLTAEQIVYFHTVTDVIASLPDEDPMHSKIYDLGADGIASDMQHGLTALVYKDTEKAREVLYSMASDETSPLQDLKQELSTYQLKDLLRVEHANGDNEHILITAGHLLRIMRNHHNNPADRLGDVSEIVYNIAHSEWVRPDIRDWFLHDYRSLGYEE